MPSAREIQMILFILGLRLARQTDCRLRLRGILHPRTAGLKRRLPRLVALGECPAAEGADSLPRQCWDVGVAGKRRETTDGLKNPSFFVFLF